MAGHDIIVMGGSAGAVDSLRELVGRLPSDLPAAVFVAVHLLPYAPSYLPKILRSAGRLPVAEAADHDPFLPGHIYVAPPDHHLLVGTDFIRVVQGPKEHGTRPAIDPLFRTAAVQHGPRVVGVLLSGLLDDGTLGLSAVKAAGGVALVQDPEEAAYPDMPRHALQQVRVDQRLRLAELGPRLAELARTPVTDVRPPVSKELEFEAAIAAWDLDAVQGPERPGQPSPFTCPDCHGDLWEMGEGLDAHFRCRTGHAWSPLSLSAGQTAALELSLNEAFRALKEKAHQEQRLARRARETGSQAGSAYHDRHAQRAERCAAVIRELLLNFHELEDTDSGAGAAAPEQPDGVAAGGADISSV